MSGALAVIAVLALGACWNGKDQFHHYMDEGRADGVPLVIYDISANDARYLYSQPVAVAFVNTQDAVIKSVVLAVAECGIKAGQVNLRTMSLEGPFDQDASFLVQPVSLPDADGKQYHMQLSHMAILSIQVTDASGVRTFSGKDVGKLIDKRVANYCAGNII